MDVVNKFVTSCGYNFRSGISNLVRAMGIDCDSLHAIIMEKFGSDLKIAGGYGRSRQDQIILTEPDPLAAARTQMQVLRYIGRLRRRFWRLVARTAAEAGGVWYERAKIETKEIHPMQVVTELVNYYFTTAAADPLHNGLPAAIGFRYPGMNSEIPYEFGWLHLDRICDNEVISPGMGYSLAYGAPGIKATIFVYDRGYAKIPEDMTRRVPQAEFALASSEVAASHSEYQDLGMNPSHRRILRRDFRGTNERSILTLGVVEDKFVKMRLTAADNPVVLGIMQASLDALVVHLGLATMSL